MCCARRARGPRLGRGKPSGHAVPGRHPADSDRLLLPLPCRRGEERGGRLRRLPVRPCARGKAGSLVGRAQERACRHHASRPEAPSVLPGDAAPGGLDQARRFWDRPQGSRSGSQHHPPAQPGRVSQHDPRPDRVRFQGGGRVPARRHGLRLRHHRRRALGLAAPAGKVHPGGGIDRGGRGSDRFAAVRNGPTAGSSSTCRGPATATG